MSETRSPTRYRRVQTILDQAAGASEADYGGVGRFWRLSPEELQDVYVHGVRMIAPPEGSRSCCGGEAESGSNGGAVPYPGRGAASGLIRGLRGEAPFDGARFPPLPWGGSRVDPADVAFISAWIDDGLPADDREISFELEPEKSAGPPDDPCHLETIPAENVESVDAAFEVFPGLPHQHESRYGQVRQRMNVDCLSESQLRGVRTAFRKLYALNKWPEDRRSYNNLALIHQSHCQHGWERFLPWHRIYLYEFEQAMEDVCPGVTMPFWDWTMPQYCPDHPEKGWRIPKALQAFLTEESLEFLMRARPQLPAEQAKILQKNIVDEGKTYYSQHRFFHDVRKLIGREYVVGAHRERFIDALLEANALWYPIRYPGEYNVNGKPGTITSVIQYHYPTADDVAQIMSLRTFRDFGGGSLYNDSFGYLDQNPHNTMHIWTGGMNPEYPLIQNRESLESLAESIPAQGLGQARNRAVRVSGRRFHTREDMYRQPQYGDMFSNLTASYDPVFWPVHSNVDRLWHEWQERNPHALPADLASVLTPWSYTIADTLNMAQFGYEYVRCAFLVPVGLETTVGRVVSRPIEIPEAVRDGIGRGEVRAEVRLHRVPQLLRSCFIRVFLNRPGADAATPIEGPNYGGYLAIFGHGECYGGPGHCDLPPGRRRDFDRRPRSHDTPRNHRVDVTRSARALIEEGATSFRISLVVLGADYREERDLLRLEGVSLNFLD